MSVMYEMRIERKAEHHSFYQWQNRKENHSSVFVFDTHMRNTTVDSLNIALISCEIYSLMLTDHISNSSREKHYSSLCSLNHHWFGENWIVEGNLNADDEQTEKMDFSNKRQKNKLQVDIFDKIGVQIDLSNKKNIAYKNTWPDVTYI